MAHKKDFESHFTGISEALSNGYTLIELLIAAAIGSIVIVMAAQSLISHLQVSSRSEAFMRSQEIWSRIKLLIDQDIEEARCIVVSPSATSVELYFPPCTASNQNSPFVRYALVGSTLVRTGPTINKNDGSLNMTESTSSYTSTTVAEGITTFKVSSNNTGSLALTYSLNLKDPSGFNFKDSKTTAAHARARIID